MSKYMTSQALADSAADSAAHSRNPGIDRPLMLTSKPATDHRSASLTHRERVQLALDHQATDRVPVSMICAYINDPARVALDEYLRRERGISAEAYLDPIIDTKAVGPVYIGPALAAGTDIWGVHRMPMSYGPAAYDEIDHYPLASAETADDLLSYAWPDPDWYDYSSLPDQIASLRAEGDDCLWLYGWGNPYELSWYMRGFEQLFMDIVLQPEIVQALLTRVTGFCIEYNRRCLEQARGEIDLVMTADDIGGQNGLLMSLPMWEKHLKPHHVRLNRAIHEFGVRVIYHSDGAVMEAVDGLIDMGIDVLEALQFDAAGMDPVQLKKKAGNRLGLAGGVSVQKTLPFGTPDYVRAKTRFLIDVLGAGGGYLCGPAHAIQALTPPANIVAMFDEMTRSIP